MNISPWMIYVIGQADRWQGVADLGMLLGVFFLVVACCASATNWDEIPRPVQKCIKILLPMAGVFVLCCILMSIFMPSSKTLAAMYVIPKIANNEQLQKDGGEIYRLAVEFAKDKLAKKGEKE